MQDPCLAWSPRGHCFSSTKHRVGADEHALTAKYGTPFTNALRRKLCYTDYRRISRISEYWWILVVVLRRSIRASQKKKKTVQKIYKNPAQGKKVSQKKKKSGKNPQKTPFSFLCLSWTNPHKSHTHPPITTNYLIAPWFVLPPPCVCCKSSVLFHLICLLTDLWWLYIITYLCYSWILITFKKSFVSHNYKFVITFINLLWKKIVAVVDLDLRKKRFKNNKTTKTH